MPMCTVVIPCYNGAEALRGALSSLIDQTFAGWEAFVVDDASTEGDVLAVVRALADDRIHYVRHDRNLGPGAARNTGIRLGAGDLIFTLDSDDELEPECLAILMDVLVADPELSFAYGDLLLTGLESGTMHYAVRDIPALLTDQWLPGPGCLFRRSIWDRVGGYSEDPALRAGNEDWEFYLAAAEFGFTARHVPQTLYRYRVAATSTGTRLQYSNAATREFIYARHRTLFDRYGKGGAFLAAGYGASAQASLERGERRRAMRFALRYVRLEPGRIRAWRLLARCLTPEAVLALRRRVRASANR